MNGSATTHVSTKMISLRTSSNLLDANRRTMDEMRQHIAKLKSELETERAKNKQTHRDKVCQLYCNIKIVFSGTVCTRKSLISLRDTCLIQIVQDVTDITVHPLSNHPNVWVQMAVVMYLCTMLEINNVVLYCIVSFKQYF